MSVSRLSIHVVIVVASLMALAAPVAAQGWNFDARLVGMGSVGETSNMATRLAGPRERRSYRSIVLPFGLIQVLKNREIYDPGDDNFNPVRAMQNIVNPVHYTFNRDEGSKAEVLVKNIVDGRLSQDLNAYRGFAPQQDLTAAGLISPTWGKTFHVAGRDRTSHFLYVGAGPYVSIGTEVNFDPNLISLWAGSSDQSIPNQTYRIHDLTEGQLAAALTGGYRVRLPLPGGSSSANGRDGIYAGTNYSYLRGVHYESADINVRLDTNSQGLIVPVPSTVPAVVDRTTAKRGTGYSVDLAGGLITGPWEISVSANGVTNRIDWEQQSARQYTITSLLSGLDFVEASMPAPAGKRRVELPVRYTTAAGYHPGKWSAEGQYEHGLQGSEFHGGGEYRIGFIEVRGGGRYVRKLWSPTGGVGLNVTRGFGIDIGVFGMSSSIDKKRTAAVAASIRFNRDVTQ